MASIQKVTRDRGIRYVTRWYDGNHVQHTKTFKTLELAKAHVRAEEARAAQGDTYDVKAGRTLFNVVAEEWMKAKLFGKPRTRGGYESLLKTHITPTFGSRPINKVTKATIQAWVKERSAEGVGAGTIRNAYRNVLKPILAHAVDAGYLRSNPAIGVKLPRSDHDEMAFLSMAQLRLLGDVIGPHHSTLVRFAGVMGLRAGEIAALRVGRLDLMRRVVHVTESASSVPGEGTVYTATKTYAQRSVPIPSFLIDELMALVAPRAASPEAFVFLTPQGKPLDHGSFMRRYFRPAVKVAVEKVTEMVEEAKAKKTEPAIATFPATLRFHDLRHTAAALMIDSHANAYDVSKRLGHSSISVTFDRYGHRFPHADEAITKGLEEAWAATTPNTEPEEAQAS